MNTLILSFILPVYNVERYLESCLHSIDDQGLNEHEFEVILVDDGSTDNSLQICREWEYKRTNYHVKRQSNQGVGSARNTGFNMASGRYVFFLDSDDLLIPHSVKPMIDYMDDRNDMLLVSRRWMKEGKTTPVTDVLDSNIVFEGGGMDYLRESGLLMYCTNCFLRREFLIEKGIEFSYHSICEDGLYMFDVLSANPRMIQIDCPVYLYIVHKESVSHDKSDRTRLSNQVRDQVDIFTKITSSLSKMDMKSKSKGIGSLQNSLKWFFHRLLLSNINILEFRSMNKHLCSMGLLLLNAKGRWPLLMNFLSLFPCCLPFCRLFYRTR